MKIFLENLYHSDCYFLPIRDNQQVLVGVELRKVRISGEILLG